MGFEVTSLESFSAYQPPSNRLSNINLSYSRRALAADLTG